jgi:hypothetical protein
MRMFAALIITLVGLVCAQAQPVDLQLVLAVDTSGSVDHTRFQLQKQGYVEAFRHPRVLEAITSGPSRAIAVTMTQWTGPALQVHVVPWTLVKDAASVQGFAAAIEDAPRQLSFGGTSISGAIDHAMKLFPQSAYKGARQVIDISGDGSNNRGRSASAARDEAVAAGAVINGLPITVLERDLARYYRDNVIGGPGAFAIAAENYETFADAILRKLIIEIAETSRTLEDVAKASGTPQIPGLKVVYLSPLGDPAAAKRWKHIIVHQTEGGPGSARIGALAQAKDHTRRGVMIWVETDGTVYWATPETAVPNHGDGANRKDNKYVDNSKTFRVVTKDNSIGVEFSGNFPDVTKPATPEQVRAWAILARFLHLRYDIPVERIYAHNWIDYKDARYCEGCDLAIQAHKLLSASPRAPRS